MGSQAGPKISTGGLVFSIDASSARGLSGTGNQVYNGAPQMVKNLMDKGNPITGYNGVYLNGPTYYTAFAIDYPESSYGGAAAGRAGLTQGFNVTSGSLIYGSSRALHLWVWDNITSSWVPDSYFTGAGLNGHCYDNYSGAENGYTNELNKFVTDYNKIRQFYPNATYIITGSHRADRYTSAVRAILEDLGNPSGYIDSDYIPDPEWILVGKPGLNIGGNYGWAYENYSTDPSKVAHLVFGLPIFGNEKNFFAFDGTDDYIATTAIGNKVTTNWTVSIWFYPTSVTNYENPIDCNYSYNGTTGNIGPRLEMSNGGVLGWIWSGDASSNSNYYYSTTLNSGLAANTWHHAVLSRNANNGILNYLNGELKTTTVSTQGSPSNTFVNTFSNIVVGKGFHLGGSERVFTGRIGMVQIYNRDLSGTEITELYNNTKRRFL